jgi:hypothetical protein
MWYIAVMTAKESATRKDIYRERAAWFDKGKEQMFRNKCKTINRYEVAGRYPLKVFFVVETDDPTALTLLADHFGDAWESVSYPIVERGILAAALETVQVEGLKKKKE